MVAVISVEGRTVFFSFLDFFYILSWFWASLPPLNMPVMPGVLKNQVCNCFAPYFHQITRTIQQNLHLYVWY